MHISKIVVILCCLVTVSSYAQVISVCCAQQNEAFNPDAPNLIQNGSFETTTCLGSDFFCPNSLSYYCDIADWICINGGPQTYAQMVYNGTTEIADGAIAAYLGNSSCYVCNNTISDSVPLCLQYLESCLVEGVQAGYPQSGIDFGAANGISLQQTVIGLTPGNDYILDFWSGGEAYYTERGLFAVDAGFGNIMLSNVSTPPGSIGTRYLVLFKAASASHTITFTNWGHICNSCTELVLDDVRLYKAADAANIDEPCEEPIMIPEPVDTLINIPNVITPDADASNQTFVVENLPANSQLTIYNRWGNKIYQSTNYKNDWDGENHSAGTYFYVLTLPDGTHKTGNITVIK
jgi:gliding motility-associated-like protein